MATPTIPTPLTTPQDDDNAQALLVKIGRYIAAALLGNLGVYTRDYQKSSAPSSFAIITSGGDLATLAAGDTLHIENLGTNPLFVKRGTGASSTSANYVLAAASVADNGTGGKLDITDFTGVVSATGTSVRILAWKA